MRIPLWPGNWLSVWERQDPKVVKVHLTYAKPIEPVRRILSKRGWMVLLVRYDWRKAGSYQPVQPRNSTEASLARIRSEVRMLCDCCGNNRERMGRIRAELGLDTDGYSREDGEGK